jgi:hypothetical protein
MSKKFAGFGLLLALLMSLSLVFAACGDNTATPATGQDSILAKQGAPKGITSPLATAFPDNTQIYFTLNTDSTSEQIASWQKIVAYLSNIPEIKKVFDNDDVVKAQGLGTYATDVQPWIGKELAIGVNDVGALTNLVSNMIPNMSKSGSQNKGSSNGASSMAALQNLPVLIGLSITDRAKAEAFVQKVLAKIPGTTNSQTKTDYKGSSLYTISFGPIQFVLAVSDNKLLLGYDAVVKAALDRTAGQGLDGNAKYKKVTSNLPTANLGFFYLDSQSVINAFMNNSLVQNLFKQFGTSPSSYLSKLDYIDSLGVAFSTNDDGFLVNTYEVLQADKESADVKATLSSGANSSNILKALPASTLAFFNTQNLASTYDSVINTFSTLGTQGKKVSDGISQFEQTSGLSVKNDILSLFKGETAVFVTSQSQVDHPKDLPVGIGLLTAISGDKTAAQASLDKITTALETAAKGQIKFESHTANGVTYKTAGITGTSSTSLNVGIVGNYVFVSVDNQFAAPVLTAATGGANFTNGPNAANFTKTQASLVGDNSGYFYVDIQQVLGLLNALPAEQQTKVKAYTDKLTQLKALGFASHTTTTESSSSFFLYFPVTK